MERPLGRQITILFAGVLLCSLFVGAVVAVDSQQSSVQSPPESTAGDVETETFEADRTVFIITVYENGNAEWQFRYEQRLENDTEVEDFEAYAEQFNTEETESFQNFRERATALTESGRNATDREMEAERFTREARVVERPPAGDEFGVIEMSFVWTDFAAVDDEEVVVGDVFVDGLYIGPDQHLRFERGPNLQFNSTEPDPDNVSAETLAESETITWLGEVSFTDRQPRVVFVERESEPDSNETAPNSESEAEPEPEAEPESESEPETAPGETDGGMPPFMAVVIVIVLGLSAAFVYRAGLFATGAAETPDPTESATDRSVDSGTPAASDGNAIGQSATETDDPVQMIPDEEFLSDEERVVTLLESHGGRMKQVDIVDQTDWSKSKVSMLLSEMESEGVISKLRVGRENIVSLAGHEPEAAGSPFDDEE